MRFDFGFYSSLLLITFSQGIIYSALLLKKAIRSGNKSNYWLSAFVFTCSLFIAPWMLGFAGWYDNQPYRDILFYVPFQHLFLMGPIIFFYTQSLLNPSFNFSKKEFLHFIPAILYIVGISSLWIYDRFIVGDYYFYADGTDKDFDYWYQYSGFVSMAVYFVLSLRYYSSYRRMIYNVASNADELLFRWIKNYLRAFLMMILLRLGFDIMANFYPELNSYTGSWWFFLFYSIVLYYIAVTGYSNAIISKIPFQLSTSNRVLLLTGTNEITEENSIDIEHQELPIQAESPEIALWKEKIATLIQRDKLYENPELTLTDVAEKLQTNVAVVSKAVNQGFQMNFNDFINNYRIEAVKNSFEKGEHKKSTLLGIAFDCGFNSKATFNRAFRKNTGLSPKEFIEKL